MNTTISKLERATRISAAIALACLFVPFGFLPLPRSMETPTIVVGVIALLAAAHFSGELKKAKKNG